MTSGRFPQATRADHAEARATTLQTQLGAKLSENEGQYPRAESSHGIAEVGNSASWGPKERSKKSRGHDCSAVESAGCRRSSCPQEGLDESRRGQTNDAQRESKMATAVPGRTDEPGGRTDDSAAEAPKNDQL